jgi:hypothetical protein
MPSPPTPAPPLVDAATTVPSLRTLGTGAQQALPGNTVLSHSVPVTYTVTTDAVDLGFTTWGTITKPGSITTVGQVKIGKVVADLDTSAIFISGVFMSWKLNAGNIQVLHISGLELNTAYTFTIEVVDA